MKKDNKIKLAHRLQLLKTTITIFLQNLKWQTYSNTAIMDEE
jgi:hypothetical protein